MGLFGGIIANALGGAGQAGVQALDQQQQQQTQLANAEDLAKLNANLDVQKQASLLNLQQQMKMGMLDRLNNDSATPAPQLPSQVSSQQNNSSLPSVSTQSPLPSQNPPSQSVPFINPDQSWSGISADAKSAAPSAKAAQIQLIQQEYDKEPDPQNKAALARELTRLGADPSQTSTNQITAPTNFQPSTNAPPSTQSGPIVWNPTRQQMASALKADLFVPGSGAKILENMAPDATGKMLLAQGIQPGSKEWNEGYQAAFIKANSENLRPGNIQTLGGKTLVSAPQDGIQQIPDGKGGFTAIQVPNYAQVKGNIEAGKLAGQNSQTLAPSTSWQVDSSGRPIPTTVTGAITNGANGTGAGFSPAEQADIDKNKVAATQNQELPNQLVQTRQTINGLQNALSLMNQLSASGPGTVKANDVWSALGNSIPGLKPGADANNYQLVTKYLNNALTAASQATGANTSNAKMEQLEHGQPDAGLLNLAPLKEATQYVLSQNDAAADRAQFITAAAKAYGAKGARNPDALAQQAWANSYNQRAPLYELNRMSPTDRQAAISKMSVDQLQALKQADAVYGQAKQQLGIQ